MRFLPCCTAMLMAVVSSSDALAARFQCRSEGAGIRNVATDGRMMSVVNPRTPNIVFTKQSDVEVRGNITRTTNDAWELTVKEGIGQLTNKTFGDKFTCVQVGS